MTPHSSKLGSHHVPKTKKTIPRGTATTRGEVTCQVNYHITPSNIIFPLYDKHSDRNTAFCKEKTRHNDTTSLTDSTVQYDRTTWKKLSKNAALYRDFVSTRTKSNYNTVQYSAINTRSYHTAVRVCLDI